MIFRHVNGDLRVGIFALRDLEPGMMNGDDGCDGDGDVCVCVCV